MNPLIVLGGLAALYYLITGEFKDEQNPDHEDRGGDGNHHRSELSSASTNVDGGKGGVTPDSEPEPAQE